MSKHGINLLGEKERGVTEKILYFALHYLRYIIVITQIVVIIVFFFRFSIDQQIVDLKEKVTQKQEIIKITKPIVIEAQAVSLKTDSIKKELSKENEVNSLINDVLSKIPDGVILFDFGINENGITLKAHATSIAVIQYLNTTLSKDKRFSKVKIDTVIKDTNGFIFSIALDV
ncbi:hypothetical protein A3D80_03245 [Candidatus Roizmanbacteria bacterium RIFCSPHIGHO2_02_FULL_40_13b]|uniref:Uncharacterized protein n=1 Tax=Candidatus Roizmanbacteria bacterium RIFCSPHIGHO2_01_FULL_39_24 TaxID=1802032 RepID=A0A1F7GLD7_9BACT|nr:MAG: hypothetical protein A2799_00990 [Candidatus Roizmanbacteria bacterium RIFCSPHIGHO2_01_FULL_39_24]OGK26983.1 MAG: hypothetical protein A3D80_03245 [Candidatus Roizmanbacteria bacterium RIFCSPHIGHO2_02_FULL_40_13b]OGK48862.1 MAG: hypothetical protein A3A56_01480 [Candidatus Roizmanbacteria bacterium RIFCSPLOWO2_01_FULL_40_32]OGK57170.1 MAG: hypothetical protein A3H83_00745 [Candidatus Roizmanbacteria bacterium RIFCSPLOWO2_02_FULL_39_8]